MSAKTASRTQFQNVVARAGLAALLFVSASAFAQVAPNLGTSGAFAGLGRNAIPTIGTFTCTDTGPGIGIFGTGGTTSPVGFTNTGCTITGGVVFPVAAAVVNDFDAAIAAVDAQNAVCTGVIPIVTTTLAPGVYCSAAATTIGAVIITLNGTASDVWVFRTGTGGLGALTLTGAQVVMGGSASPCNVYWKTTAADMTTTDSAFVGTVLSAGAITMTRGSWTGRALATLDVTFTDPQPMTSCAVLAAGSSRIPTLSAWAMILLAGLLAVAGFVAMRKQR